METQRDDIVIDAFRMAATMAGTPVADLLVLLAAELAEERAKYRVKGTRLLLDVDPATLEEIDKLLKSSTRPPPAGSSR